MIIQLVHACNIWEITAILWHGKIGETTDSFVFFLIDPIYSTIYPWRSGKTRQIVLHGDFLVMEGLPTSLALRHSVSFRGVTSPSTSCWITVMCSILDMAKIWLLPLSSFWVSWATSETTANWTTGWLQPTRNSTNGAMIPTGQVALMSSPNNPLGWGAWSH